MVVLSLPALIAYYSFVRPHSGRRGVPKDLIWEMKASAPSKYEVVFVGDSRVYRGLSPEAFEKASGLKALNFGFSSAGLHREYIAAATKKFSNEARRRIILIGVTAHSLTNKAFRRKDYENNKVETNALTPLTWKGYYLLDHLRPVDMRELKYVYYDLTPTQYETYHPNGWVETDSLRLRPTRAVQSYINQFEMTKIEDNNINELLGAVSDFKKQKIEFYAFSPPISNAMAEVESKYSGFQKKEFIKAFKKSGGHWIPVKRKSYVSYDGSHVNASSAKRLTRKLAKTIKESNPSDG